MKPKYIETFGKNLAPNGHTNIEIRLRVKKQHHIRKRNEEFAY